MNKDELAGEWKKLKGKIKEKWGKFTDDELTRIDGKKDQFVGELQKKYGYTKEQAAKEYEEFKKNSPE